MCGRVFLTIRLRCFFRCTHWFLEWQERKCVVVYRRWLNLLYPRYRCWRLNCCKQWLVLSVNFRELRHHTSTRKESVREIRCYYNCVWKVLIEGLRDGFLLIVEVNPWMHLIRPSSYHTRVVTTVFGPEAVYHRDIVICYLPVRFDVHLLTKVVLPFRCFHGLEFGA